MPCESAHCVIQLQREKTTKPIIFDGDAGGLTEHFVYTVRSLERMGVSAVIIEDKTGLKKNSLFGTNVVQTQDSIENFSAKIKAGKKVQLTDDFMIIARIESLILERGMEDALTRAKAFVDAGADGIMIHSGRKEPAEILEFCDKLREFDKTTPIVVVPSSFNTVTEAELAEHGVNIVIYANQLTRSAFPAMKIICVENFNDLDRELENAKGRNELSFIEVKSSIGAREDLGRPTTTALENKQNFMNYLSTL